MGEGQLNAGSGGGPGLDSGAGTEARPRLGVLLVTSGWFREVGLQGAGSDTTREAARAGAAVVKRLEEFADPVYDGVLFSTSEAEKAARRILAAGVDGVLCAPLMWCEDAIPRAALAIVKGLPLVLWTWSPGPSLPDVVPFQVMLRGSGAVCTMQLSGMLKRERTAFWSVAGHAEGGDGTRVARRHDMSGPSLARAALWFSLLVAFTLAAKADTPRCAEHPLFPTHIG